MNKLIQLLDNCDETIKKLAKFCFLFFIVIAISYFLLGILNIIGAISMLNEYGVSSFSEILYEISDFLYGMREASIAELMLETDEVFKNLFGGLMFCILSVFSILASILSIPLYGFGCIVEDVKVIRKKTENIISK